MDVTKFPGKKMKKDCTQLIMSNFNTLTANEKKLATFLVNNIKSAISMNIRDVAVNADVSQATVSRYAKTMGFDGYKGLRIELAKRLSPHDEMVVNFDSNESPARAQIRKTLDATADSIKLTLEGMNFETVEKAARLIAACENMLFFGVGTSEIACIDASLKFRRIRKNALHYCDLHTAAIALPAFGANDVAIGISHTGETESTCEALRLAKSLGVKTIAITSYLDSTIAVMSDLALHSISRENPIHKIAITSRISQLSVIDALFSATLMLDYDRSMENILKVAALVGEIKNS